MKQIVKKGATSNLFCIFIQDSSSTTGAGLTGLTSGSASLVCYRARADDGNAGGTAISLSAGTKGTWSSGGFVEKDATNMPGVYELGVPDAVFATGSNYGIVMLKGATNQAPVVMEFELIGADLQDAVHLGLSSLPNTACTTNASLLTSGTGTDQLSVTSGRTDIGKALGTAVTLDANNVLNVSAKYVGGTLQTARDIGASVLLSAGTGTGQLDFTSGVVKSNLAQILGTALTETSGQIAAAFKKFFNIATPASTMDHLTLLDTVTTYTGNTPQTGDNYARTGAPAGASVSADIAAVKVDTAAVKVQTDKLAFTVANKVDANMLATNGDATAAANVAKTTRAIVRCTASGVPTTTSIPTSACAPAGVDADQFKGRIITFDADTTTTGLRGQSTDITASSASATPTFTCTALTSAPSSGDSFSIT